MTDKWKYRSVSLKNSTYSMLNDLQKTFDMNNIWKTEGKFYSGIEMPGGHFFVDQFPLETFKVIDDFIKA